VDCSGFFFMASVFLSESLKTCCNQVTGNGQCPPSDQPNSCCCRANRKSPDQPRLIGTIGCDIRQLVTVTYANPSQIFRRSNPPKLGVWSETLLSDSLELKLTGPRLKKILEREGLGTHTPPRPLWPERLTAWELAGQPRAQLCRRPPGVLARRSTSLV
jgi:hypothetical protein